jgi:hypothetical protein
MVNIGTKNTESCTVMVNIGAKNTELYYNG